MAIEDNLNRRAVELSPQDSVLFLYNLSSGNNYNTSDVSVSELKEDHPDGSAAVLITGKNNRGLTGVGPIKGVSRFTYVRPNLSTFNIVADGSFFDVFRDGPSFIGAVKEFTRRTGFNCTADDFDEEAFYPDEDGNRWLKARPGSWRFVGKLALGRPRRESISDALPMPISAGLSTYDGVFFNNADRLGLNLIISHRPEDFNRLAPGMRLTNPTDSLLQFILDHLKRKGIEAAISVNPIGGVNLFGLTVTYKGVLRQGDVAPVPTTDRVISLTIEAPSGLWSSGQVRLYYNSKGTKSPSMTASKVTPLSMKTPISLAASYNAVLRSITIGKRLAVISDVRTISEMFLAVTGIDYNPELYGDLVVVYNGPNRPYDQLPFGKVSARVVVFQKNLQLPIAVSGDLKFIYEAV